MFNATLKKNIRKKFNSTICGLIVVPFTKEPIERYGLVALLELADGTSEVNLERVLNYSITQE